jgi:GTP-binding protein
MVIKSAVFEISNTNVDKCPKGSRAEFAFIGRSNVGKSSLINKLLQRKTLAKTSGKPGKTQLINHFLVNEKWYLVDLPGYGYAKVSKTQKEKFQGFITDYFFKREQLTCAFVLIDIRLEPQKIDLDFMAFMAENGIPFAMVFTKADKITLNKVNQNISYYHKVMEQYWEEMPYHFVTSAETGLGREELLNYLDDLAKENL